MMDDGVAGDQQQPRNDDAKKSGQQSDKERLRVEDAADVLLRSADGAKNTDLFSPLQNADKGDDADHDGRYHQ